MRQAFIGVDVGTSSARAGVFDENGNAARDRPASDHGLARSGQRRRTIVVRDLGSMRHLGSRRDGGGSPAAFRRQGHGVRCDVLARGARRRRQSADGQRVRATNGAMSSSGWTIAPIAEARAVNDTHDDVLRYVGGSISPEMEIPKLLWLKRHLPSTCEFGRAFLRSRRLSFIPRHRVDRALDLHAGLQVEFPGARAALERELFRARRSRRPRWRGLRENRQGDRRAGHRRWARV